MWHKTNSSAKRIVVIAILTLVLGQLYGQSISTRERYFIIDFSQTEPRAQSYMPISAPPQSDQSLLFALKTNLAFDALTIINFELEIPIRDRWSVAGEILFPWWSMDNKRADSRRDRLQLLNGNIEGKYWWGDRSNKPPLTGWFTGLYSGIGTYDLEHNARGYQGDIFFSLGVSGGYAHPINRRGDLRLEYTLGVGYFTTYYHYYEAEFCDYNVWHAIEMRKGRYKWFGPTRAKVSLSWLIDYKKRR